MTKGERIKELRQKAGISQVELAKRIGVSKQTLYKYENNIITNIPSDKIELLSNVLNTTPEYIMGWALSSDEVQKTGHEVGYYDHETLEMAQALYDNPDLRALMKAAMSTNKDSIPSLTQLLYTMKGTNPDG